MISILFIYSIPTSAAFGFSHFLIIILKQIKNETKIVIIGAG